jgi:hypothetical protein
MQQNYTMLSGSGPGSGRYGKVPGNAGGGNNPVIAIHCFTIMTFVLVLPKGSTLKHRDALPGSTLNHDSSLRGRAGFPDIL